MNDVPNVGLGAFWKHDGLSYRRLRWLSSNGVGFAGYGTNWSGGFTILTFTNHYNFADTAGVGKGPP